MKLENQVVSLELSKKLKELGVKQDSLFYWNLLDGDAISQPDYQIFDFEPADKENSWSAFTASELGEMLPYEIELNQFDEVYLGIAKDFDEWKLWYEGVDENGNDFKWESIVAETEADARAKMLIYLIENKLITLNQTN